MRYDLEKLKKSTKIKLIFMSISIAIPIIVVFLIMLPISEKYCEKWVSMPTKVLTFVVLGLSDAFIITRVVMYGVILGSEDYASKVLIRKNDEREIFIRQKEAVFTIKMMLFLCAIGCLISGFLSTVVFITLASVSVVMLVTLAITRLYYRKKY